MNITSTTLRKGLKRNTYTPQKLGFDNRRPFNMGLHSQNEQKPDDSPFKMSENEYYYKIGGKTVTKAQYNAYENPVGDGPTKSTNDPDASGNKAKIQKNRSTNKASKRPTVLTKEQTKLKGQGTKITKKPPFKKVDPKVLAMMKKRGIPTSKQNKKGGSGYLTTKGSVATENGERKKTIAEKMEGVADKITANAGGGPTQFLAEATGIPSLMRLPKSYQRVAEDPSGKNLLSAGANTLGVLPGVTGLAKGASKYLPQAAKYIDPTVSLLNKVNKAKATKTLKKGKKAKVMLENV
tara:strand:+ start:613 stop:1494 length:882 start_codon:yes stop_codon:yes gene_type:complete